MTAPDLLVSPLHDALDRFLAQPARSPRGLREVAERLSELARTHQRPELQPVIARTVRERGGTWTELLPELDAYLLWRAQREQERDPPDLEGLAEARLSLRRLCAALRPGPAGWLLDVRHLSPELDDAYFVARLRDRVIYPGEPGPGVGMDHRWWARPDGVSWSWRPELSTLEERARAWAGSEDRPGAALVDLAADLTSWRLLEPVADAAALSPLAEALLSAPAEALEAALAWHCEYAAGMAWEQPATHFWVACACLRRSQLAFLLELLGPAAQTPAVAAALDEADTDFREALEECGLSRALGPYRATPDSHWWWRRP